MNTWAASDTSAARGGGLWVDYLYKHTRALTSCFLLPGERSRKQSDSGDASEQLDGPLGARRSRMLLRPLQIGKMLQRAASQGNTCSSCTVAIWSGCAYNTQHASHSLWPKNTDSSQLHLLNWRELLLYIKAEEIMRTDCVYMTLLDPVSSLEILLCLLV